MVYSKDARSGRSSSQSARPKAHPQRRRTVAEQERADAAGAWREWLNSDLKRISRDYYNQKGGVLSIPSPVRGGVDRYENESGGENSASPRFTYERTGPVRSYQRPKAHALRTRQSASVGDSTSPRRETVTLVDLDDGEDEEVDEVIDLAQEAWLDDIDSELEAFKRENETVLRSLL